MLRTVVGFAMVAALYAYLSFKIQPGASQTLGDEWLVVPGFLGLVQFAVTILDFGLWHGSLENEISLGPDGIWIWVVIEAVVTVITFALTLRA